MIERFPNTHDRQLHRKSTVCANVHILPIQIAVILNCYFKVETSERCSLQNLVSLAHTRFNFRHIASGVSTNTTHSPDTSIHGAGFGDTTTNPF